MRSRLLQVYSALVDEEKKMIKVVRSTFAGLLFVLLFIGCGEDSGLPTTRPAQQPTPTPNPTTGFIWAKVFGEGSGLCLPDAVVEIVAGPHTGQKVVQNEPCSAWDEGGVQFDGLPLGVSIKLRATKEGYRTKEVKTMAITSGTALQIILRKK
jgi:hypothetical protein